MLEVTVAENTRSGTRARVRSPLLVFATVLSLCILSLLPRLVGLNEATTEDEDQWMHRTGNFAQALTVGAWRSTYQVGHPGVTTMWLTDLALGRDWARHFAEVERGNRLVTQVPDFVSALRTARLRFALVNALLATACALLAWRLFGAGPGLLSGVLLALDPYWSAMSPIVGMDGLLSGLMAASLLSTLVAFDKELRGSSSRWSSDGRVWPLGSGLLAGLALMTKGPAMFLLPMAPLLALRAWWQVRHRSDVWRWNALKLAMWAVGVVAAAGIWPAMWVDPLGTIGRAAEFIRDIGTTPHAPGNFLLGQPVSDPGSLFYPVAVGLRLGPATVVGLIALAILGPSRPRGTGPVGPLLDYVVLLGLGLTLSAKKVDRYILPLFPVLDVLAAVGWWLAARQLARGFRRSLFLPAGVALAGLLQLWPLLSAAPHPLSAYNPLFGGMRAAEQALPVGWGEGLDSVGDYLKQQPNASQLVTAIWFPLYVNFQAHAPGRVVNISFNGPGRVANQQLFATADFYVDYIHARQRRLTPSALLSREPDFVVAINGAEYARVYRLRGH